MENQTWRRQSVTAFFPVKLLGSVVELINDVSTRNIKTCAFAGIMGARDAGKMDTVAMGGYSSEMQGKMGHQKKEEIMELHIYDGNRWAGRDDIC